MIATDYRNDQAAGADDMSAQSLVSLVPRLVPWRVRPSWQHEIEVRLGVNTSQLGSSAASAKYANLPLSGTSMLKDMRLAGEKKGRFPLVFSEV